MKEKTISKRTLRMIDRAVKNLKEGKVGKPIDLDRYPYAKPSDCPRCNGHSWELWRVRRTRGPPIAEVKACPDCNPAGDKPPPIREKENP